MKNRPANPSLREKAAAIADAAADVIEHGDGVAWMRDEWSDAPDGNWSNPDATRWCASGACRALADAVGLTNEYWPIVNLIADTSASGLLPEINDDQGREAAIRALRKAARKLRRKGAQR